MTIYLAGEDVDDASLFKDAVTSIFSDVNLVTSCKGEKLIKRLETDTDLPDIIFLDLNMPKRNGLECLKKIKSNLSWKAIKTVVLSTTLDDNEINRCYSLGADIFITKPNSYSKLKVDLARCFL